MIHWDERKMVSGEEAVNFNAVLLDSYANANEGPLVSADANTGSVYWKDAAGEVKNKTFGEHRIRIMRRVI
jgi:hypothetical protein